MIPQKDLYDLAKESYYNGDPIMSDLEFDELENELGLENTGYIGTNHSDNYTIKHPFIMGSLSKIQIKEDKSGNIDWPTYHNILKEYINNSNNKTEEGYLIISPKFDGCSFEMIFNNVGKLLSASTRGDGNWGKDISNWVHNELNSAYYINLKSWCKKYLQSDNKLIIRGEVLIALDIFEQKYSKTYTNPRSFVAGLINQDWEGTQEQETMRKDLSFICYDYRIYNENANPKYIEIPFKAFDLESYKKYNDNTELPGNKPSYMMYISKNLNSNSFKECYYKMNEYRNKSISNGGSEFALDGFVVKPNEVDRIYDPERARPKDCVAIKFLPEIKETEIEDIEWKVGKTGEYFPTAVCKKIILGDKEVTRASLHNYNYLISNCVGIGSKVKVSLAGDIIPFIYSVETQSDKIKIPNELSYIETDENSGVQHLMKKMTTIEKNYIQFMGSVGVMQIKGIGPKVAEKLFNIFDKNITNIIELFSEESYNIILNILGDSKSTRNIINALKSRKETLNIFEIIYSCCFDGCGAKMSEYVTNVIIGNNPDSGGIQSNIIDWANNSSSNERKTIQKYIEMFDIKFDNIKISDESEDKIKVILTGSPSEVTQYSTKKDWLKAHLKYEETSSWKECQILFTDDLDSTSGKMNKAKKLGIEIKRYDCD